MNPLIARLARKLIPAVPVPFNVEGQIDRMAQARYVEWMAQQRVAGIAVWAHTGRGLLLNEDQRSEVLESWRSGIGDGLVVCGAGCFRKKYPDDPAARTREVVTDVMHMAEAAREGGADAILLYPPAPLRDLPDLNERVVDVHRAASSSGLPVIAFHLYEAAGGIAYAHALVESVLDLEQVIGIKVATLDSVVTYQDIARLVDTLPNKLLITGEDRFLGYSLMMGGGAALIGMAASCTDVMVRLVDLWFDGGAAEFLALSERVDRFAACAFGHPVAGYIQRMLWALEIEDVLPEGMSDSYGPGLPFSERVRLVRAIEELRCDHTA